MIRKLEEVGLTFPSALWLILFFAIPTTVIVVYAFKPGDLYGGIGEGWTFDNILNLFTTSHLSIIWRTIWFSFVTTAICLLLALPVCFFLAQTNPVNRRILLLLIVVPFWSSFLIRVFAWKSLLHPEGFLKQTLVALKIVDPDTLLLYNSASVLLVMVYTYLPFAILPLFAAAEKFNFQLFEAATDLGASRSQAFFKVFVPSIKPGMLTAFLMVFIPAMGAYVIPDIVGGINTEVLGNKIAQRTFVDRDLPEASALSLSLAVAVLVPMMLIIWVQSPSIKKISARRRRA
jgi:spermidine/putrescine transport system permease protein